MYFFWLFKDINKLGKISTLMVKGPHDGFENYLSSTCNIKTQWSAHKKITHKYRSMHRMETVFLPFIKMVLILVKKHQSQTLLLATFSGFLKFEIFRFLTLKVEDSPAAAFMFLDKTISIL